MGEKPLVEDGIRTEILIFSLWQYLSCTSRQGRSIAAQKQKVSAELETELLNYLECSYIAKKHLNSNTV